MAMDANVRRGRKPKGNAEIRVRVDVQTKNWAERFFKRHGITTSDGVRLLLSQAMTEDALPRIPSAESLEAIEESLAGGGEIVTVADLRRQWDEA